MMRFRTRTLKVCLFIFGALYYFSASMNSNAERVGSDKEYDYRIVVISDTQPGGESDFERMAKAIEVVNLLQPDIILYPGDITSTGTEPEYKRVKELISKFEAPVYMVPGNHDAIVGVGDEEKKLGYDELHERKIALFNKYLGKESWSVELGNFQFIGFDSTEVNEDRLQHKGFVCDNDLMIHGPFWPYISSARQKWLLETCRASSKPYKFLVTHYPSVCHRCILSHNSPYHGREKAPITSDHVDYTLSTAGVVGHIFGHRHLLEADQDPDTGRLMFDSCSAVHHCGGLMYFDVYGDTLVCFWKPIEGSVKPMGVFNLQEAKSAVSEKNH